MINADNNLPDNKTDGMKREIVNPIYHYAIKPAGNRSAGKKANELGVYFEIPVDDPALFGHLIPSCVKDNDQYLDEYSKLINKTSNISEFQPNEVITPDIITAKSPQAEISPLDDTSNFIINPLHKICYIDVNGKNIHSMEKILCEIIIEYCNPTELIIRTSEIDMLSKIVTKQYSQAMVNTLNPKAEKILALNFRHKTKQIPIIKCYQNQGWQFIDGRLRYVHDAMVHNTNVKIETGMSLPSYRNYSNMDIGGILLKAFDLNRNKSISCTLVLFSLLGVLYKVFNQAGYPPKFLLFMNGKTGSFKTTLAKILFIQLAKPKNRDNPRRIDADTINSLERAIVTSGRDTVLLLDDYAPAKTAHKKGELANKL